MILILDYGSQYTQLIARRVRELEVYSQVCHPENLDTINASQVEGIVLSGGPNSVYDKDAYPLPKKILEWNVPILGVCYGAQLLAHALGGKVEPSGQREYGVSHLTIETKNSLLFSNLESKKTSQVWMSHGDKISSIPPEFVCSATSPGSPFAAFESTKKPFYAIQFHAEVTHTEMGAQLLKNFLFLICKAKPNWTSQHFISHQLEHIQKTVGDKHVVCGLSGGVDSTVMAVMLHKALGKNVTAIFVDHGLLRLNEKKQVDQNIREAFGLELVTVDAKEEFLSALKNVSDPEEKRKIIGKKFIDVFERESKKIPNVSFLGQGTIYPDVIESASHGGSSVTIKSHHNVGGLPEKLNLKLIEPLRELFKDEVRRVGKELGIQNSFIDRHPFPGPGLAVRILGEITEEKISILQKADHIFIEELHKQNLYHSTWQAFVVLLPVRSVGVMGDFRTYDYTCALRAVNSVDGMTADWTRFPLEFLAHVSSRITNEVKGINRVVYDISSKPPATIEWE